MLLNVVFCWWFSANILATVIQCNTLDGKLSAAALHRCSSLRDQDLYLEDIRRKQWHGI